MSRQPSPFSNRHKLNISTPAAADIKLGNLLEDALIALNALRSDHNALVAKLNNDAGVTDTNYAVSTAAAQTLLAAR